MSDYHSRFHPVAGAGLIERMKRFPVLAMALSAPDCPVNPIRGLTGSSHKTTAMVATMLCGHFYDSNAGGVDIIDLYKRMDAENRAALVAFLGEL